MQHEDYGTFRTPASDKWKKALTHAILNGSKMTFCDVWHLDDLEPTFAGDGSAFCVDCAKELRRRELL